ncbi:MAG: flavin reductase [Oscillospiraceae bacterium]|nr:flavin reductase [Oscillospiraceae bacterium]
MNNTALNNISYGLYVLTASENGKDNGCIINTLMQQTSSPLRVSVTVNKANLTCDMIANTGLFNVSMLDTTTPFELIKHFGFQSGRNAQKFEVPEVYGFKPYYADNGLIYLKEHTCAFLSCKVISQTDLGSHIMFMAEVTDGDTISKNPPMTYAYYHANVKPKPAQKPEDNAQSKKGWVCKICGYIYEGEELPKDYVCPICKHGAEDFEKIDG